MKSIRSKAAILMEGAPNAPPLLELRNKTIEATSETDEKKVGSDYLDEKDIATAEQLIAELHPLADVPLALIFPEIISIKKWLMWCFTKKKIDRREVVNEMRLNRKETALLS